MKCVLLKFVHALKTSSPAPSGRRGAITVLTALLMVMMMGFLAFSIDTGYIATVKTELQRATDAAAYAGASELINGSTSARAEAFEFLGLNKVGNKALTSTDAQIDFGHWDSVAKSFVVSEEQPSAVRVVASSGQQPLFFGRVFGRDQFNTQARAIAIYQPRDIVMVLDYSGSMCYDSQFRNISLLGQAAIQANLQQIWNELGSPTYGTLTWTPVAYGTSSTSTTNVKNHFGLNLVSYPFPDGSWSEYIDYVKTDSFINSAGYRRKYGMMTFLNYLMAKEGSIDSTPGLWATSQQPVTALKDAVDVFLSYLTAHSTDDRVGLSIYTFTDGTAKLESALTSDFASIATICRQRQAGHYTGGTNISAGMTKARVQLQNNARLGAKKIMLLMTDGVVNLPSGNTTNDKAAVIAEANLAAAAKIPIVTISLGAYADTALMQQVADLTGGAAFVVAGGQPIANVQEQLELVFAQVAASRPLKLVE